MMDLDFSILESSQVSLRTSSLLSGQLHQSSHSSAEGEPLPQIEIPSSSGGGDFGGFELADPATEPRGPERRLTFETDETGFLPDVDFNFDDEGNIIDFGALEAALEPELPVLPRHRSELQAREPIVQGHQEDILTAPQLVSPHIYIPSSFG